MILQESGEMYLETIHILSLEKEHVRSIDISEHMGFSKPSVSRAMKILRENQYINIDPEGYITLTKSGQEIAEKIYERHQIISSIFIHLGVDADIATEDACRIEHVISDQTFAAIKKYCESLSTKE